MPGRASGDGQRAAGGGHTDEGLRERRQGTRDGEGEFLRCHAAQREVRAETLCARKELVEERVVDHAENGPLLVDEADGDRDVREAVDEVGRAVWGVVSAPPRDERRVTGLWGRHRTSGCR